MLAARALIGYDRHVQLLAEPGHTGFRLRRTSEPGYQEAYVVVAPRGTQERRVHVGACLPG